MEERPQEKWNWNIGDAVSCVARYTKVSVKTEQDKILSS